MKIIALALGLSIALAASAADSPRAKLVSQRLITSYPGAPILVCKYVTAQTKYEVVAASTSCPAYLALEEYSIRDTFAAAP
ncbi:MAG: hypothetical protein ABSG30_17035 [Steroidobacteraceae bacterium]|jgi:hypothetical protein